MSWIFSNKSHSNDNNNEDLNYQLTNFELSTLKKMSLKEVFEKLDLEYDENIMAEIEMLSQPK